jgi:fucokinase
MGIQPSEIWSADSLAIGDCSLWNARIFPLMGKTDRPEVALWLQHTERPSSHTLRYWRGCVRISFEDALGLADPLKEFMWRRELGFQLDLLYLEHVLLNRESLSLLSILRRTALSGKDRVLEVLDMIAANSEADVAARALSTIADLLATYPEAENYLRSGPSRNTAWLKAFDLLLNGDQHDAVLELARVRSSWMHEPFEPQTIIRAARHYEGAAQILLRRIVQSNPVFGIVGIRKDLKATTGWNEVSCPARIDLAGGWTDTLPISYEHGGLVINVAVKLDGKRPVGARCRLLDRPVVVIAGGTSTGIQDCLECHSI